MNTISSNVSFLVDHKGKKTHAVLPIKEYERLVEDQFDNAVADSRINEVTTSFDEAKARIRARRISG